jgi:hypothetical protein
MEAPGSSLRAQRRRKTMAIDKSYSGMLGGLARLTTAMAANSADLPHLDGVRTRLEKLLADAQEAAKQQAALVASKQEATLRLRTLLAEGQRVATGAQKMLQENYGLRAEKLAEFGLQPFRGRKLKAKTPEAPAPSPVPSPSPAPAPAPVTPAASPGAGHPTA